MAEAQDQAGAPRTSPTTSEEQQKVFEKYIVDKRIVIADSSNTSRSSIANLLVKMGAKTALIALAPNYVSAEQEIDRTKPHVVICDYDLGKRCGLDLLQKQRQSNPEVKQSLFVLVTGNTSQSAVARAAEEDVDTFVIKPFTAETLRQTILRVAMAKLKPSAYAVAIDKGKGELAEGKIDEAMATFRKAATLDKTPSLAWFYYGQAKLMKQAMDEAKAGYGKGLEYNKIHYKCMVGLYEVHMSEKRFAEAYDIIKRISHYFPANPQRLNAVLRLAVFTQSYEDVERYYRIFTNIEERNEEMIKYVCAALVVCGKYYLQQSSRSRAIELFTKAAITASGRVKILREIIGALIGFDLAKEAEEFLRRFPPEIRGGPDYLAMDLLVKNHTLPPGAVIGLARELLAKNVHDPIIYQILIRRSAEAGFADGLDGLVRDASTRWPDQKDTFAKLAATKKKTAPKAEAQKQG